MMYYRKLENKQSDEWIVLLHGLCGNTAMWAQQIFTFNKHYNILLLDLPGHGNSTNAVIENNIKDMSDVARVIIDIMDENNIKKAHFAGVSLGTIVAAKISILYPERVSSIILCGAVIGTTILDTIKSETLKLCSKIMKPLTVAQLWVDFFLDKGERKYSRSLFVEGSKKLTKHDLITWIRMAAQEGKILLDVDYKNTNIYFIMGENDHVFLKEVQKLKEKIKTFKLTVIEDCGHVCNMQKPEIYNDLLLNYIGTI